MMNTADEVAGQVMRRSIFRHIVRSLHPREPTRACLVGINGVDTAGKTLFAQQLEQYMQCHGYHTCLVHLDDFHNPAHIRGQGSNEIDSYLENAFNLVKLRDELLQPLRNGDLINKELTLLDLDSDTFTNCKRFYIDRETVVILEGVLLYREPLVHYFDYKVYLDISFDEVLRRAEQRDVPRYGVTFLERYRKKYIPVQQKYISGYLPRERSDLIVDNTDYNKPVIVDFPY